MHMHAAACDGTLQKELIRKSRFVAQCRREDGVREDFP